MEGIKRRRMELAGFRGVNHSAVVAMMAKVRQRPSIAEEVTHRHQLSRALEPVAAAVCTTTQLCVDGEDFPLLHASPQKLMTLFLQECQGFRAMLSQRHEATPSSYDAPWHVIMYSDEVTIGNPLATDQDRKVHAFYMSFRELGLAVLSREDAWLPILIVRGSMVKGIVGGLSSVMRIPLRQCFLGDESFSMVGIMLELREPTIIFAELGNIVGDGDALRAIWGCKGASGLLPCFSCKNVTLKGHPIVARDASHYLVDITCSEFARFDLCTNEEHWDKADNLTAQKHVLNNTRFKKLEKSYGLNHCTEGLLQDEALRPHVKPATVHTEDGMHTFLSSGLCQLEIGLFLTAAKQNIRTDGKAWPVYQQLEIFCGADWKFPKWYPKKAPAISSLFNAAREKAGGESFNATASEILAVMPLLECFTHKFIAPTGRLDKECASFHSLCCCVKMLQEAKRTGNNVDPQELQHEIALHQRLFVEAYGVDEVIPKHHRAFHLPGQLLRDKQLIDCFVHERKHKIIKGQAGSITNTKSYERTTLLRVIVQQMVNMPTTFANSILGRVEPFPELGLGAANISCELRFEGLHIFEGDLLVVDDSVVIVIGCLEVSGNLCICCDLLEEVERDTPTSAIFLPDPRRRGMLCKLAGRTLRHPTCWSVRADNRITILR